MTLADLVRGALRRLGRGLTRAGERRPHAAPRRPPPEPAGQPRGILRGRSALIVGAGMNIGLGIARELAGEEATLFLTNVSEEDLNQVLSRLRSGGFAAVGLQSDVTDAGAADRLPALLDAHGMTPDILVLNAGVHTRRGDSEVEEMERVFRTNILGPLYLARRIAERMRSAGNGGAIVFLSSIHQWTVFGDPMYSATKGAIGMLVRELALEYASAGIRVNAIAPGWVKTDPDGAPLPHRYTPLHQTSVPPAFIGKAALFLAADSWSGHTTGTVLTVDGGLSLVNYLTDRHPAHPIG